MLEDVFAWQVKNARKDSFAQKQFCTKGNFYLLHISFTTLNKHYTDDYVPENITYLVDMLLSSLQISIVNATSYKL